MDPDARYDENNKYSVVLVQKNWTQPTFERITIREKHYKSGSSSIWNATPEEDYTSKWLGESERTESHKRAM